MVFMHNITRQHVKGSKNNAKLVTLLKFFTLPLQRFIHKLKFSWSTVQCPLTARLLAQPVCCGISSPFYQHGLTLIPAWISNYVHCKMWDEITYPSPNFNGCTVEVWEWISNFIPHITGGM